MKNTQNQNLEAIDIVSDQNNNQKRQMSKRDMNESSNRLGEAGPVPFRSDRFFCVGNKWYFSTREGFDSGPYSSKVRARNGLDKFIAVIQMMGDPAQNGGQLST